jgi:hypothetical protein
VAEPAAYVCNECGSPIEVGVALAPEDRVPASCTNPTCRYFGVSSQKHFGWAVLKKNSHP